MIQTLLYGSRSVSIMVIVNQNGLIPTKDGRLKPDPCFMYHVVYVNSPKFRFLKRQSNCLQVRFRHYIKHFDKTPMSDHIFYLPQENLLRD